MLDTTRDTSLTVNVHCGDISVQVRLDHLPPIGSKFHFYSSRDSKGNYRKKENDASNMGDVRKVLCGIVKDIDFSHEECGDCSQTYWQRTFVELTLEPAE